MWKKDCAPQLLQGVLQCRGVRERNTKPGGSLTNSQPLARFPSFPAMPHFFHPSLLPSLPSIVLGLPASLSLSLFSAHTYTHKALVVFWRIVTATEATVNTKHHMVAVGSVLQCLGLEVAVGQQGDSGGLCPAVCVCVRLETPGGYSWSV